MTTTKIEETPDRLAAARAAAARRHHEARADWLRDRGYLCFAPGDVIKHRTEENMDYMPNPHVVIVDTIVTWAQSQPTPKRQP